MSAQLKTFGRLDAAELNQLNTLLNECADAHALEELDGLICGFVSGPHLPPREQWLPLALGQSELPAGEAGLVLRELKLRGRVKRTIVGGKAVFEKGHIVR